MLLSGQSLDTVNSAQMQLHSWPVCVALPVVVRKFSAADQILAMRMLRHSQSSAFQSFLYWFKWILFPHLVLISRNVCRFVFWVVMSTEIWQHELSPPPPPAISNVFQTLIKEWKLVLLKSGHKHQELSGSAESYLAPWLHHYFLVSLSKVDFQMKLTI